MNKKLSANIWKYGVYLVANKRIFVPILGAYYLTIEGVTAESIGIILLAGSLAGFILEIPSGYVSDKMGHKTALVFSRILMFASSALFLFANSLLLLILGGIFLSAAHAFHSGTGNAFMHETLRGLKREGDYARVMGKIGSIGFAVPIVLTVLIPFLVDISFKLPFVVALVVDLVGILASALLVSPAVIPEEIEEIRLTKFRQVVREGHTLNFFIFALFAGLMSGTLFAVGWFRAPYQVFLEIPVIWYGVFFGIGRALSSLMMAFSGKIREKTTLFSFYRFQFVIFSLFIISLGLITEPWIIVAIFIIINAFQWGLSKVGSSYLIDIIRTSKFKATLLSIKSQIDKIVSGVVSFGVGFAIERLSYQYGFLYLGIAFVVIMLPLYIYMTKIGKETNIGLKSVG